MNYKKKKYLLIIGILNVLLLAVGSIIILHGHQDNITLYDFPLYSSQGRYDDGEDKLFRTDYPASHYWFAGRTDSLQPGIYNITVYYSTDKDYYTVSCESAIDGNPYPAVYSESCTLLSLNHSFDYRIWVNSRIDYLEVRIECGPGQEIFQFDSSFYLDKVEIVRDYRMTVFYGLTKLLGLLLLINGIFAVFWNAGKIKVNFNVVLGLTCIFMISSLSIMGKFIVEGHDASFHYARIVGLAGGLTSGNFPVRIQPDWFNGYGYAVSACYGDLLLYIPAILYALGVPLVHVYKLYVLLINLGTLLITYFCFKKLSNHKYIGITCAALYCLSVSRILNIYLRSAVGEYSAFMFLPLVLLGMKEIYSIDADKTENNGWLFLCLGMTGIIQTHVLSLEMVCIFIAVTVMILITRMSKNVFVSLIKSVLATLSLNLGFLLPFLDYAADSLNVFSGKAVYGIQQLGLSIYELFSFGTVGKGQAYESLLGLGNRIPESLGLAMLIILLIAVIVLVKCQDWKSGEKGQFLVAVGLSFIALLMSTYYFPWNRLAAVPVLRNVVASIQFPWRFLSIAIPLLTYVAGLALVKLKDMIGKERLSYLLIGICLLSVFQGLYCMDLINRNAESYEIPYDNHTSLDFNASGSEYLLANTNAGQIWSETDVVGDNIQILSTERKGTQIEVACRADENASIDFPLFAYKYYRCIDAKTQKTYPITRGKNNKIHVDLPDNYQGTLKVYFAEPWYWRVSELTSLVTFVFILLYIWRRYCRNAFQNNNCI